MQNLNGRETIKVHNKQNKYFYDCNQTVLLSASFRYCGAVGPRIVSSSNKLLVKFTSDQYVCLKGFDATYRFVEQEIGRLSLTFY